MVDAPRAIVEVGRHDSDNSVTGSSDELRRAESWLRALRETEAAASWPPLSVQIRQPLPAHRGLGSGTQLALAVGRAVSVLQDKHVSTPELARRLGRGRRSAVGVYGFDLGGLIVDAGLRSGDDLGQLAAHADVPDDWRWLLVWPEQTAGLAGDDEASAFRNLDPVPEETTGRLARLVLTEILPAMHHRDARAFAEALDDYGQLVGRIFEPIQGGVVSSAASPVWNWLRNAGVRGVAQTSWGPTLAAFCESPAAADALRQALLAASRDLPAVTVLVAPPRNRGADIALS